METETVTLMFTDLVDSTSLLSRVGESAGEALRREHFGLLRSVIEERGGREVKNLGDGLMVKFASAADAVAAGASVQRAFERRNRRAPQPLRVRVGIAAGDAVVAEDDYFGVTVVQAARLCDAADGGEVLCSDVVRVLGGTRVAVSFEPAGELELKGLDEPVASVRVLWEPLDESELVALPARLAVAVTERFVGRAAEYEVMSEARRRAAVDGSAGVVLVSGEPGIGKTTLAAHVARDVQVEGALVVYGRCDEDLGIPYQPWIEAMSLVVSHASDEVLRSHVEDRGPGAHLASLVPALAQRTGAPVPTGDHGDGDRFVVMGCVSDLLARAASDTPVLVVLEDLHWADRESLQLLRHVAASALDVPLLVLGTFRDSDVAGDDPMSALLAALHRVQGVERVALHGLDESALLDFLELTAGHEIGDQGVALRDAVLAETDGNPFFASEILQHLAETGVLYQDGSGRWVGDLDVRSAGLPVSVTEVIGRRVAALGADTEQLLALGSVIGRDFDISVLASAAGADELDVVDRCDAAVAAGVLRPTMVVDRYTFTHALIGRTVYESMSPSRRSRAHRAIAEAIESIAADDLARAGELAYHWSAAGPSTDHTKASRYSQLAGDRALDQFAPDEAVRWYSHALQLLEQGDAEPSVRVEVMIGLGIAQRLSGLAEHRGTLLDAAALADSLGEPELVVRAALATFRGFQSNASGTDPERLAAIDRAVDLVSADDSPERAQLLIMSAVESVLGSELRHRLALIREAIDISRRIGDPSLRAVVLSVGPLAVDHPSTVAVRRAWCVEALTLLGSLTDPFMRRSVHRQCMLTALDVGDIDAIIEHDLACRELEERTPDPAREWMAVVHRVTPALLGGDLAEAERLSEAALEIGVDAEQPDANFVHVAQLVSIRHHQGLLHELFPIGRAVTGARAVNRALGCLAHALSGDHDTAVAMLDNDLRRGFQVHEDATWLLTVASWAHAAGRVAHRQAAAMLHQLLAPHRGLLVNATVVVQYAVEMYLGMLEHTLGRYDDADRSFAAADTMHRRLDSPNLIAEGEANWALMLVDRGADGDADRARALATGALAVAGARGYGYTEALAREVLSRVGR